TGQQEALAQWRHPEVDERMLHVCPAKAAKMRAGSRDGAPCGDRLNVHGKTSRGSRTPTHSESPCPRGCKMKQPLIGSRNATSTMRQRSKTVHRSMTTE